MAVLKGLRRPLEPLEQLSLRLLTRRGQHAATARLRDKRQAFIGAHSYIDSMPINRVSEADRKSRTTNSNNVVYRLKYAHRNKPDYPTIKRIIEEAREEAVAKWNMGIPLTDFIKEVVYYRLYQYFLGISNRQSFI